MGSTLSTSTTPEHRFPISEIFGPTIQGEGPLAGLPCHFVRFGGCDFRCVWCDTPYAVLPTHVRKTPRFTAREIVGQIDDLPGAPKWVIFSGGNPVLHRLDELVHQLRRRAYMIQVETQGSMWRPWLLRVQQLVVSPKPPSSEQRDVERKLKSFLTRCDPKNVSLKVVVFDDRDYEFAEAIHTAYPQFPFYVSLGDRMGGLTGVAFGGAQDTVEEWRARYRWLCERVASDIHMGTVRVLPQLHKLAWARERNH